MHKWIKESDNGTLMLRCSNCDCRVMLEHYERAVGLKGYDYCPYCGAKMERPKPVQDRIDSMDLPWTDCDEETGHETGKKRLDEFNRQIRMTDL